MALVTYNKLIEVFEQILTDTGFTKTEAELCAKIFADSTADGYLSHGVNRFEVFINTITDGYVQLGVEPERELALGSFERWNGKLGAGPLNADFSMKRAIELAKESGIGCVALRNGSHWMRGGTYGWQAAEAGCIALCFTNTMPNMPSWGAKEANTGNNPLIVAVPQEEGHIVLDMSLSQFSYGKMQQLEMDGKDLPFTGGYTAEGELTTNPKAILDSKRLLPTGYWKGSGLSILVDLLVTLLSSGKSTAKIGEMEAEYGLSQVFICFDAKQMNSDNRHKELVDEIINHVTSVAPVKEGGTIEYPGSQTRKRREQNMKDGIQINDEVWNTLLARI
ncbi:3-dehydro-L-gulonate 2-dehydrogenase [Aurantibacter crassamenti]|uniref:3-dehydro-L-gulonate 2-dehydrogenase n=1 Tax=Aurantibacter crassamenti TaxID=1837375 RepID=UPI00193A7554|nr:3-dehydro-L-gulonate 2-dehydrogenase [Aurantibacter crassamenti]MBM1105709.1 3-dehydro-L-gulonate 2-dehydrogenase [Aurantibacter crassamenti]